MPLYTRQPNKPKAVKISGEDYYDLRGGAARLGIEKSTLRKRLYAGYYSFRFGKLGTTPNAPLMVAVSDVESFLRTAQAQTFVLLGGKK